MLASARRIGKLGSTALVAAVTFVTESSPDAQTLPAIHTRDCSGYEAAMQRLRYIRLTLGGLH
jgi:hypothetical protein